MPDVVALVADPAAWAALATLIAMEIVLGVDNLVFIAVLSNRIASASRGRVRRLGMGLALAFRIALLGSIVAVARLTAPLFVAIGHSFSLRDLVMLLGGLFLVWKATREIHAHVEPERDGKSGQDTSPLGTAAAIAQIVLLDVVFSIDSIVTAVGMTDQVAIMVCAVVIAVLIMMAMAGPLAEFIHRNPTVVMLALSFLVMIGMTLIADGFGFHVPRGYIYAAMLFSSAVEALNALARKVRAKVQ